MSLYPVSNYNIGTGISTEFLDSISSPDGSLVVSFANGVATFTNTITGTITQANLVNLLTDSTSGSYYILFSKTSSGYNQEYTASILYNPFTDTLTVSNIVGTITTASVANQIIPQATPTVSVKYLTFVENSGTAQDLLVDKTLPLTYTPSTGTISLTNVSVSDGIYFKSGTTNDQRLYWNTTYGLVLSSPTTPTFGGRILLNQITLEDRITANDWNTYTTANKLTFDYNGSVVADLSQTGNLILRGTDARIQFRQSTTNDQRLYWDTTYGLILDSPTTPTFGGRILLNQLSLQTGGNWNYLTGIDLNAKPIANASTISCSGNITTSAGNITATTGDIIASDGNFGTYGLGAGYYNYDRAATPTTFWVNFVPSGAATNIFYYRIPATVTNLEIFRMTNTGLLSTIGSFTNGATGKGLQLGDRATTGGTGWQVYNDTAIFNCAYQSTLSGALATKFRCNASGQFDILGTLASLGLADRSNNNSFWAIYHNGGTLGFYNNQDRMTLSSAGKLSIVSDLDVGTANPATTTINMSGTTRCQITTTLATMGTLIWDVGYMNLTSGTVSSAVGTIEVSTTKFAYYHNQTFYNGMPFACSKLGELEVNHDTNAGGGSSLWYVPCYWNNGASPIGGIKQVNTTTVSFPTTSDRRLKEQIEDLEENRVSTIIDNLKPRKYIWKESQEPAIGFIADELQAVMPDCVYGEPDAVNDKGQPEYQTADSASPSMIAVLVAELQFLRKRVSKLENFISQIELI